MLTWCAGLFFVPTMINSTTLCLFALGILDLAFFSNAQFYGTIRQEGRTYFYNQGSLERDVALEERSRRLANGEFKAFAAEIVETVSAEAGQTMYNTWLERGSTFLYDGITAIPENSDIDESKCDPRAVKGINDPLYQEIHFNLLGQSQFNDVTIEALENIQPDVVKTGFILINGIGDGYYGNRYYGKFSELYENSPNNIIRVVCESCISSHQEVFYKRLTAAPQDLLQIIQRDWRSANNIFNTDFKLYSTYKNAIDDVEPWKFCGGFDLPGNVGFPGYCGPESEVLDQWIDIPTKTGQQDVAIFVEDSSASVNDYTLTSQEEQWELERLELSGNLSSKGLCWHIPYRDIRLACWRSCSFAESFTTSDLGALKLCSDLKSIGQTWLMKNRSNYNEVNEGSEAGSKVKPSHALGLDFGVY
mmetsp:Transcript_9843/g.13927  ORF Transcript_9843/g.13927 Transcript_9843/m.13927 type:complete len:419 (+) Transcript_9843:31-1287(+)